MSDKYQEDQTKYLRRFSVPIIFKPNFFNTKGKRHSGRGFAISPRHVMTNQHVVDAKDGKYHVAGLSPRAIKRIVTARELGFGQSPRELDIAIIEFYHPHGLPIVHLAQADPKVNDMLMFTNKHGSLLFGRLHFTGTHLDCLKRMHASGLINLNDRHYDQGRRALNFMDKPYPGFASMYTGISVIPGDSGSPLFDQTGAVVGIFHSLDTITRQGMAHTVSDMYRVMNAYYTHYGKK